MTISEKLESRAIAERALEALRAECADQNQMNELLWAMVKSLRDAKAQANG